MEQIVQVNSVALAPIGAPGSLMLLPGNPNRVYVIIACGTGVAPWFVCTAGDGTTEYAFAVIAIGDTRDWRRHDYGPLVQGEWWATDGFGNSPDANINVTEGILISGG